MDYMNCTIWFVCIIYLQKFAYVCMFIALLFCYSTWVATKLLRYIASCYDLRMYICICALYLAHNMHNKYVQCGSSGVKWLFGGDVNRFWIFWNWRFRSNWNTWIDMNYILTYLARRVDLYSFIWTNYLSVYLNT